MQSAFGAFYREYLVRSEEAVVRGSPPPSSRPRTGLRICDPLSPEHGRATRSRRSRTAAGIARAAWPFSARVEKAGDLEQALRAAFVYNGPALVDVATFRHELAMPRTLAYGQIKGFTLYATRTILSGQGSEIFELAKTNLRELEVE